MKTIRRKYKRRLTSRDKNKKLKKCRQSIRQKKCKTKKIYHYRKNNKILYQSGGEDSDDDDEVGGEEPASQEDIDLAIRTAVPMSPRVKKELYKYRGYDSVTRERCMEYPSKNTLFGKVLEEQFADHFFKENFPGDNTWRFEQYLKSPPTIEHDISPDLTSGMGAISIKSKRIGQMVGKTLVSTGSKCSYQICSADAVRFVKQILSDQPLTLVVIYYNIETPGVLLRDNTIRVYDIRSQLNAIWGGYKKDEQRIGLAIRIQELSGLFSTAQDSEDVKKIEKNIADIKRMVKALQAEMKKMKPSFVLAPKISSKCGKEEEMGPCKHQCRLQVVLNVKNLSLAGQLTTEPGSPTSIRGKGASFGVAKTPARAKTPASARGQSGKTPASARGQSGKTPARAKTPASARGRGSASARGASVSARGSARGSTRGASVSASVSARGSASTRSASARSASAKSKAAASELQPILE